ncbi:MAG TPA: hypothetical protein VF432_01710 [Thermoanaerobaculia bacterium]
MSLPRSKITAQGQISIPAEITRMTHVPPEKLITLRFGWVWRSIGLLFVFLAVAFPVLMMLNNEELDASISIAMGLMAVAGVLTYLYYRKYEVRILGNGFQVSRLLRPVCDVSWDRVRSVRFSGNDLEFELSDGRVVTVNGYLAGVQTLLDSANEHLPKWG